MSEGFDVGYKIEWRPNGVRNSSQLLPKDGFNDLKLDGFGEDSNGARDSGGSTGSGEDDDEAFFTPSQSFDGLGEAPRISPAGAVPPGSEKASLPSPSPLHVEGVVASRWLGQALGEGSVLPQEQPTLELRPMEKVDSHLHAVRGCVGPLPEGGGEVILTLSNEHSWIRRSPARYIFSLAPAAHPTAEAPGPAALSGAAGNGHAGLLSEPQRLVRERSAGEQEPEQDEMPFDEYFRLGSGPSGERRLGARAHGDGLLQRLPSSASQTALGPIALAMASDFPLTLAQMLPLAKALAVSSRQHESLVAFLERRLPAGFPVQFTLAVFPTVSATVTFGRCAVYQRGADGSAHPDAPTQQLFEIPDDYARGKYKNFGERFLDG